MSKRKHDKLDVPEEKAVVEADVVEDTVVEETAGPVMVVGVVTDCSKLNVREKPKANAKILTEIPVKSDVIINEEESTKEFYKVCTATGVEGYCMKKYITIQ